MSESGTDHTPPAVAEAAARARIERAVTRARLNLVWEELWPRLAPLVGLGALFAVLSWFGVWRFTGDTVRLVILALFGIAALFLLVRFAWIGRPNPAAGLARVEAETGINHRPATAFTDRLATGAQDPTALALWSAHRTRLLAALDRLNAGVPRPGLARRDPYALRFVVVLLFVVAFVYAGSEHSDRLGEAFRGGEPTAATVARIDAWVTPPAYTGRAPIFLTGDAAKAAGTQFSVPTGSVVTVRTGGARDLDVLGIAESGETLPGVINASAAPSTDGTDQPLERQIKLTRPQTIFIRKGDRDITSWRFAVDPDSPPQIAYLKDPSPTASGALSLNYSLKDDYGVVSANAEMVPVGSGSGAAVRPLYKAPSIPLSLPELRTREGNGETIRDLTSHPWAGSKVTMTLVAKDEAGQEGRSAPAEVTLPARQFADPIARAVVEQRGRLAQDANAAPLVADALDAISSAPEKTIDKASTYLALRSAYYRLLSAQSDDDLRGEVDYLWSIALGLEDGDLSLAADDLRAAQDALRQALENNASDAEIARLTQNLRDAMQRYLQALAQQAQQNPMAQMPPGANVQTLRAQDLEKMLDQIEQLSKNGARDAARQLLSQLQNMLENLQAGQPMNGGQQGQQQMMQSLNQLGDMIRQQQQLMDQTNRLDRGEGPDGQPLTDQQLQDALKQMQQGQQGLQQQLSQLMQQLQGMGMQGNGKLGQAGEAMGRALGALQRGSAGQAVPSQGDALEALRQGAQGLAQQFANRGQGGGMRGGDNFPNEDPLGRPQRTTGPDLGTTVKVPDEIDIQRAREILETIRQRLGLPGIPDVERDYLERLLDKF